MSFLSIYVRIGIAFWLFFVMLAVAKLVILHDDSPEHTRMFGFFTMLIGGFSSVAFWPLHLIVLAVILMRMRDK